MQMREIDYDLLPNKEAEELRRLYKEAAKSRDQEMIAQYRSKLINLYVYYGESFKFSDKPDPMSAKWCLKKALELQHNHPVANYRYGHLLYAEKNYTLAADYFKKAIDASPYECLDDTQLLIANIIMVNCGLLIAEKAIREVEELECKIERDSAEAKKREDYLSRMLIESEAKLKQHLYQKITLSGKEFISYDRFIAEKDEIRSEHIKICVTHEERSIQFDVLPSLTITQTEFYVIHTIMMSERYLETKDIHEALKGVEHINSPNTIRKCLSRLKQKLPYWDQIVDTKEQGNYVARKRRNGIHYALIQHSSISIPHREY